MTTTFSKKTPYNGTCQACFCQFVSKTIGKGTEPKLVHHGFKRPGIGYIVGDCCGQGKLPYELSCEVTKAFLENNKVLLDNLERRLDQLNLDLVDTLLIEVRDYEEQFNHRRWGKNVYKNVTIGRDYVESYNHLSEDIRIAYGLGYNLVNPRTFEHYRQAEIRKTEGQIKEVKLTIVFLTKKVEDWRYAPEALKEVPVKVTYLHYATKYGRSACNNRRGRNSTRDVQYVTCPDCKSRLEIDSKEKTA